VAREQRVLSGQGKRADQVFDSVGVDLDPAILEEGLQAVPVSMDIADRVAARAGRARQAVVARIAVDL
jgi:hypothetical protein